MLDHERQCIARRAGEMEVSWSYHNAFEAPPGPALLEGADAVLIGGSGDFSVYDPRGRPWVVPLLTFVEAALAQEVPAFGICFGHQLLGEVMGGEVALDRATAEVGTVRLQLTEAGRLDPVFGKLPASFQAHTGHTDRVLETPAGVELLATGDTLAIQAFRVRGAPFWSAQFHPDLTGDEARSRYLAYSSALGTPDTAAAPGAADPFVPGADDTAPLLASFLAWLDR